MKLHLAYYGDPILRQKAKPIENIDESIRELVQDMDEAMERHNGCGLAAPQIHRSIALFIVRFPKYDNDDNYIGAGDLRVFINPKILSYSDEIWPYDEGCLSIPGMRDIVPRPFKVKMEATDLDGNRFVEEFEEYEAHMVLHENDHLNGVLYIDRLSPKQRKRWEPHLREIKKKHHPSG